MERFSVVPKKMSCLKCCANTRMPVIREIALKKYGAAILISMAAVWMIYCQAKEIFKGRHTIEL